MGLERLCNLREGDIFMYFNLEREVREVDNEYIYYGTRGSDDCFHQSSKIGRNSQQKVELVKMKNKISTYVKQKEIHKNTPFRIKNGQGFYLQDGKEIPKQEWEANNPVPEYHNYNEDNPDKTRIN